MRKEISYDRLPEHMRHGARLWVEHEKMTSSFLTAVMEDRFLEAWACADAVNTALMHAWAQWLWNEAPRECHGSPEKVQAWRERGGLTGNPHDEREP